MRCPTVGARVAWRGVAANAGLAAKRTQLAAITTLTTPKVTLPIRVWTSLTCLRDELRSANTTQHNYTRRECDCKGNEHEKRMQRSLIVSAHGVDVVDRACSWR